MPRVGEETLPTEVLHPDHARGDGGAQTLRSTGRDIGQPRPQARASIGAGPPRSPRSRLRRASIGRLRPPGAGRGYQRARGSVHAVRGQGRARRWDRVDRGVPFGPARQGHASSARGGTRGGDHRRPLSHGIRRRRMEEIETEFTAGCTHGREGDCAGCAGGGDVPAVLGGVPSA